jgi:hypothetical protein
VLPVRRPPSVLLSTTNTVAVFTVAGSRSRSASTVIVAGRIGTFAAGWPATMEIATVWPVLTRPLGSPEEPPPQPKKRAARSATETTGTADGWGRRAMQVSSGARL